MMNVDIEFIERTVLVLINSHTSGQARVAAEALAREFDIR